MVDQFLILAEEGSHGGGVSPVLIGGGMFVLMLLLLGVTYLFSGQNQPGSAPKEPADEDESAAPQSSTRH